MVEPYTLQCLKLSKHAKLPTRATVGSAGLDLYSSEDIQLEPNERKIIRTALRVEIPLGYSARITSRSGLAYHQQVDVITGIIDSDYRGEILVIPHNFGHLPYLITIGDRIAQMIMEVTPLFLPKEVNSLPTTERGTGGLGSTGI